MSEFDLQVSEELEYKLIKLSKWFRFIAVLSFVAVIVLTIYGIYIFWIKETPNSSTMEGGAFIAFMVSFVLVFPTLFLFLSARNLQESIIHRTQSQLEKGLGYLINFFVISLFLSAIFLSICGLAIYYSE